MNDGELRGVTRLTIPVKLVGKHARMPTQHYRGDAGFDLYASNDMIVPVDGYKNIPTGVFIQLHPSMWGLIQGRSSSLAKRGLLVNTAVIDSGWRGELFFGVRNLTHSPVHVKTGERVAQFIPMNVVLADHLELVAVDELEEHERGLNGFGSSGR